MCEALDATSKVEVEEISSRIELSDEIVLTFIHDGVENAYCRSKSLRPGRMVYLDATGTSNWDEVIRQSFQSCYALLCGHKGAASPLVLFREQARLKLLGRDEELPGSAAVLTVGSKRSIEPGA